MWYPRTVHGAGCYAHSIHDYEHFESYFVAVLASYSGVHEEAARTATKTATRELSTLADDATNEMKNRLDFAKLGLPFVQIQMTCVRNLADLPLSPAMNRVNRVGLEQKLVVALAKLQMSAQLRGECISLGTNTVCWSTPSFGYHLLVNHEATVAKPSFELSDPTDDTTKLYHEATLRFLRPRLLRKIDPCTISGCSRRPKY
jgi:hypothetical protein